MQEPYPSSPLLSDPDRSLAILRAIIVEGAQRNEYPLEAVIRARSEPWLVDDLGRANYVSGSNGWLVPTIAGLRAAGTPEAEESLGQTRRLFEELKRLYVESPGRVLLSRELAQALGLPETVVGRLLGLLVVSAPAFGSGFWDASGKRIGGVTPQPIILEGDPFEDVHPAPAPTQRGPLRLTAQDLNVLSRVDWSPEGVCLVVGPNGSGKTTLLQALAFLRDAFQRGVTEAVRAHGGPAGFRRVGAEGAPEVVLRAAIGDLSWELRLPVNDDSVHELPGESVALGGKVLLRRGAYQADWYLGRNLRAPDPDGRTCLRSAWDAQAIPAAAPLVHALRSFRYYFNYSLGALRNGGEGADTDRSLDATGRNLFVVLRNWKVAPRRFRDQFAWVLRHTRRAFPGLLDDIEFEPPVGQVVPARFFPPGGRAPLPMSRAADGMLVGLLHLTAVAGADDGAVVAIDEMENQLHPHAIRALLEAMREIADERRLTILLTTHSPVLMNAFRDHPEQLYVMEEGAATLPVRLDKLHDPDWLAHFELGDLYERMEFGAPKRAQAG
jgi:predicted ATPase